MHLWPPMDWNCAPAQCLFWAAWVMEWALAEPALVDAAMKPDLAMMARFDVAVRCELAAQFALARALD